MLYVLTLFAAAFCIILLPISWIEGVLVMIILCLIHNNYRRPGGV